ncbi:phosphoribosyltransferase [Curtobacterium sp. RRHDQ10]|uniref:phosphoribosyltransferase n=1 Tax=Curtobacterium phyllosphaerae TaxID=3413379 RepID=UPI003BF3609F
MPIQPEPTDASTPPSEDLVPASAPSPGPEVLGWLEFGDAARLLAQDVLDSGFVPDVVVAVARGGLLIGGAVAYALDTKMCGSINVEFYSDVEQRLAAPVVLPPALDAPSLAGRKVLVVDDVSDSGRTLALVVDIVRDAGADVRSACLYSKPGTVLEPDHVWRRVDGWITFPWSAMPPVTAEVGA